MKKGITSAAYLKSEDYSFCMSRAKKHGFDCLDYQGFLCNDSGLFTMCAADWDKKLSRLLSAAKENGMSFFQCHGPWRYPPEDGPEERIERFDKMSRSIVGAAALECPNIVIHPLFPYGWDDTEHGKETFEINVEFFSRLCEIGKQYGVTVCIENMPAVGSPLKIPADVLELVKTIGSPNCRFCLDTGHSTMESGALSPANAVRLVGKEYLAVMHVHDNMGQFDEHLLPGTGIIDWDAYCASLREIGYDGVFNCETRVDYDDPALADQYEAEEKALADTIIRLADAASGAERP